jgi:GTP pyrophosphokinase
MRTLHYINNEERRKRIALETMDVHSALAERIGLHSFKNELQDLAFTQLYFQDKKRIEKQLDKLRRGDENLVTNIITELDQVICKADVGPVEISGREKTICSIWRKIQEKRLSFDNLPDIFAFRIIAPDLIGCYKVLGAIHERYQMLSGGFKDYISNPKPNGYKSLHTVIIGPNNKRIEVQIRTKKMHEIAEFGVAAHWEYKQQLPDDNQKDNLWIGKILSILDSSVDTTEMLENSKIEMHYHHIFCFTPKGELIALPTGATPLDFAFHVHSNIGFKCVGVRVNNKIEPLTYKLENGDQVEIICAEKNKISDSWVDILCTGKAKNEVKKYLSEKERNDLIELGRSVFQHHLDDLYIVYNKNNIKFPLKGVNQCNNVNDLFYAIGSGKLKVKNAIKIIYPNFKKRRAIFQLFFLLKKSIHNIKKGVFFISHSTKHSNINWRLSKCCFPVKGDDALWFLDDSEGHCIHRVQCSKLNLIHEQGGKLKNLPWAEVSHVSKYQSEIIVLITNKIGSLKTVIDLISFSRINMFNIKITKKFEDFFECSIILEVKDAESLEELLTKLKKLKTVYSAIRHIE